MCSFFKFVLSVAENSFCDRPIDEFCWLTSSFVMIMGDVMLYAFTATAT